MLALIATTLLIFSVSSAQAAELKHTALACSLCDGLARQMSGDVAQPFIFRSFEPANGGSALHPSLENTGFTYDNALALIALIGCNRVAEAKRVADAFVTALETDRHYHDGRLRNAYRSGPVAVGKDGMLLPGYWNSASNSWVEDGYQVGTATGSTAWAALSLLSAYQKTGQQIYLDSASKIMEWIHRNTEDDSNTGYLGGFFGHEPAPMRATWKSTEHNLDVYAVDMWLASIDKQGPWADQADKALKFLTEMWNAQEGRFYIGSVPDSNKPNIGMSGLDAELWPLIAVPVFADMRDAVIDWTEKNHGVPGGFDFNSDRDGIWLEGTAQAALVMEVSGHGDKADALFKTIAAQVSPGQLVYATVNEELTTGLQVGPNSAPGDFKYFRLPHIGATGWAILAALKLNPFLPPTNTPDAPSSDGGDPCRQKS